MVFSSAVFLLMYLPIVIVVYKFLPIKQRNLFLLIVNLIFYGWGEPVFILLMLFSTAANYLFGYYIDKYRSNERLTKALLVISVIVNLGMLAFFKYANFISDTLSILPFLNIKELSIPLPIGISFYTFQTMSYTIDVYRNDAPVQKNLIAFGTYVTLFPQLIAGPIVRYQDVAEQMENRQETLDMFTNGVKLFMVGLSKKLLLANPMGILWDTLRPTMDQNGSLGNIMGILAYTFQIYFDFSGYSDMARGLGNMFGFEFLKNFDYPYISKTITEFWRRWHISLGTWFREYVYIPLGGNRKGKSRMIFNLFITWMLTGLWHGASWNFVLWGLYFGVVLILEKLFLMKYLNRLPAVLSHIYSLILIVFGWVIFYFEDMKEMGAFIAGLFDFSNGVISANAFAVVMSFLPLIIAAAIASTPLAYKLYERIKQAKQFWVVETALVTLSLIICTASVVSQSYNPFLYFRF